MKRKRLKIGYAKWKQKVAKANGGRKSMGHLTLRIAVALLTFAVGIAIVWLLLFRHTANEATMSKQSQQLSATQEAEVKEEKPTLETKQPAAKRLYITTPIKWDEDNWTQEASIVIFYDNGEWGRETPHITYIRKDKKRLFVMYAYGYRAEIGKWKEEADGTIVITIEKRRCFLCKVDPEHKQTMPIIEYWTIGKAGLGQRGKILKSPSEEYRLLEKEEFSLPKQLEEVLSAPFDLMKDNDPAVEDY
jgi:hypothetical protein